MKQFLPVAFLCAILTACGPAEQQSQTGSDEQITGRDSPAASQEQMAGQEIAGTDHPGAAVFDETCASCHLGGVERAMHISALRMMPYDAVLRVLTNGVMAEQASDLTEQQKQDVAAYLTGGAGAKADVPLPPKCEGLAAEFDWNDPPHAVGWGIDRENTRFIPGNEAQLYPDEVEQLELKWSFAYPHATRARSQPSFGGGQLMVGSQDGTVYAFEWATGCLRWTFKANAEVRTGLTLTGWTAGTQPGSPPLAYFADLLARVYAVNMVTGELVWESKVGIHPNATTTAQPVLYEGVLYQPISSLEVVPATEPDYPCCNFRGSIVALDALTGEEKWRSHTITEPLVQTRLNAAGTPNFGPSGAPIWNSPTVDEKRRRLYAGTGENYSSPAQGSSDAIIAFDLDTGEIEWITQTVAGDAWNVACMPNTPHPENCPEENGPDVDISSPPIHVKDGEREILVVAQKNGMAYGMDPETGNLIWQKQVGRGGNQGGVHFGMAAEGTTVFVPMSDYDDRMLPLSEAKPGLFALDAFTGDILWSQIADNVCGERENCDPGISAPATVIDGVVFVGHMDGRLRAHDTATGDILWQFNADQSFTTPVGAQARGGSFGGGSGIIVHRGRVYANSGYGIYFHMPGNVLLVFGPKD